MLGLLPQISYHSPQLIDKLRSKLSQLPLPSSEGQLFQRDVKGHFGCVNTVEFDKSENFLASSGDDGRVLIWALTDMMRVEPTPTPIAVMEERHDSNVFNVQFSLDASRVYSGGNDNMIKYHDITTKATLNQWFLTHPIYSMDISPVDDRIFSATTGNGSLFFLDCRTEEPVICVPMRQPTPSYCGRFNPATPHIFGLSNQSVGFSFRDVRKPKAVYTDFSALTGTNTMHCEFDKEGGSVALHIGGKSQILLLDLHTEGCTRFSSANFKNKHTIKSVRFLGPNHIMSGSDNFKIHVWRIPDPKRPEVNGLILHQRVKTEAFILSGHRSVVNQVSYSKQHCLLVSCGIEKIIKLWSPFEMPGSSTEPKLRNPTIFPPLRGIGIPMEVRNDESSEDMEEDTLMMAYFDTVVNGTAEDSDDELDVDMSIYLPTHDEPLMADAEVQAEEEESESSNDDHLGISLDDDKSDEDDEMNSNDDNDDDDDDDDSVDDDDDDETEDEYEEEEQETDDDDDDNDENDVENRSSGEYPLDDGSMDIEGRLELMQAEIAHLIELGQNLDETFALEEARNRSASFDCSSDEVSSSSSDDNCSYSRWSSMDSDND